MQFENDTISNWNFNISSILSVKPLHVEFLYDYSILMEFGWHKHLFAQKMKSYQKTKQNKINVTGQKSYVPLYVCIQKQNEFGILLFNITQTDVHVVELLSQCSK